MKIPVVGLMQPYYFPYLGYFSHIFACDSYVFHNDTQYTKKGWINRNRFLAGTSVSVLTLPLSAAPANALISEKLIAPIYRPDKHFRIIEGAYRKAPFWDELRNNLPALLENEEPNLSDHLTSTIERLCHLLEIKTPLASSSELQISRETTGQARVIQVCKTVGAGTYLNPEGGKDLYDWREFARHRLDLSFISHTPTSYPQRAFENEKVAPVPFVERLSVLDALAEIGLAETRLRVRSDFTIIAAHDA